VRVARDSHKPVGGKWLHQYYDLYRSLRVQFLILLMMDAVTPEACRVALQWINICILLHLLDFYSHWIMMHRTTSLKFINYMIVCLHCNTIHIKLLVFWTSSNVEYSEQNAIFQTLSVLKLKSGEVTVWLGPVERVDLSQWFECSQPSRFILNLLPEDRKRSAFLALCFGWHTTWWKESRNPIILSHHILLL